MLYFEFINELVWGEAPDELHEKQMRKLRKACGNVAMPKKVGRRSKTSEKVEYRADNRGGMVSLTMRCGGRLK